VGWVSCGAKELTVDNPFYALSYLLDGTEDGYLSRIYYSGSEFEQATRDGWQSNPAGFNLWLAPLFTSPQWVALTNQALTNRVGFFEAVTDTSDGAVRHIAIRDLAGESVDDLSVLSTRSGGTIAGALGAALDVDVNLNQVLRPSQATVDSRTTSEYVVTNLSLSPAYGIQSVLPIPAGMRVLAATGSQGQGSITNDQVLYEIGPLAPGSAATVRLDLAPTRTGLLNALDPASVAVGDGLADPNPSNNTVTPTPLMAMPPLLSFAKAADGVELSWVSETGLTALQSAAVLNGIVQWRSVTNAPMASGSTRTVYVPVNGSNMFYRLRFIEP